MQAVLVGIFVVVLLLLELGQEQKPLQPLICRSLVLRSVAVIVCFHCGGGGDDDESKSYLDGVGCLRYMNFHCNVFSFCCVISREVAIILQPSPYHCVKQFFYVGETLPETRIEGEKKRRVTKV